MYPVRWLCLAVALAPFAIGAQPLLSPPLEIAGAPSLPWGDPANPEAALPGYDVTRLASDTMALLTAQAPIIVRMETLRRAAVYARRDPRAARQIHALLLDRVRRAEEYGKADAVSLFNLGYLVEIAKQAPWLDWDPFAEMNGYALVRRALRITGDDAGMEFAAALILAEPAGQIFFTRHLKFAVAQAQEGSLLAKNLVIHFRDRGKTLAELKAARIPR